MLTTAYVGLRGIHFAALMLLFGCALFINRLAPRHLSRLLVRRFSCLQTCCLWCGAISAVLLYAFQGGMMGDGWGDVFQPQIWAELAGTRFGAIGVWQIIIATITLILAWLHPHQQGRLMSLVGVQLMLMAGVGHAAMREGFVGMLQRGNHALHLLAAASWVGGLLPVVWCLRMAQGHWKKQAVLAMMRFSRYGHLAVACVLVTGIANTLLIQGHLWSGDTDYGRFLLIKCALVALMVAIALVNRYVLVPRSGHKNSRARDALIWMTWTEVVLGAFVLAIVSLFATWEPF